ncbi:MAG: glycoside hydrolase family 2 TIM barrel-domain containing protein [Asticcacaulis sp.]
MPRLLALAALCLSLSALSCETAAAQARIALDTGWRFLRADAKGAEASDFRDADWRLTTLPHSYNAADGDDGGDYYRGTVWYRKTLDLKPLPANRRLYIQFDGAALVGDLFINGRFVARHEGGTTAFRHDISRLITSGRNVIAMRVSNAVWPQVASPDGHQTVFGGLNRGVSLIETRDAGFDWLDHAAPPVSVKSTDIAPRAAKLSLSVAVRNQRSHATKLIVQTRIFDAAGKPVFNASKAVNVSAGGTGRAELSGELMSPHLWNGHDDPYLYTAVTEITDDNATLDKTSTTFGIRTVSFDPLKGLLLNAQPYAVNGVVYNPARPGKGTAVTRADIAEDFDLMSEMGVTAIRLPQGPQPQAVYDEADRRGLLVLSDLPLGGAPGTGQAFGENAAQQWRELIRQNRHHPSIIAWGLGTVDGSDPATLALLRTLNTLAATEDPTRPVLYTQTPGADDDVRSQITTLSGFARLSPNAAASDATGFAQWADAFHKRAPRRALALTAYGAPGSPAHQDGAPEGLKPDAGWHGEQAQAQWHEQMWAAIEPRPFVWGRFVNQMFDAPADSLNAGTRAGLDDTGLVSYDRQTQKDAFWYYKAQWSKAPVVYIAARRLYERTSARIDIRIYTNQPQISLSVNGAKIATQTPANGLVVFKSVPLSPGYNVIQAENGRYYDRISLNLNPPLSVIEGGSR